MKVFLSWSGDLSRCVAALLRDWLQNVLQTLPVFMSDKDIESGARWNDVISSNLEESDFGIIVVTREGQDKPWLLFEAGALAKSF